MSGRDTDATRAANGVPDGDLVGLDGWPLGGPSDAQFAHAAETRLRRDMQAALERWRGGDLTAYIEAVWLYWHHPPDKFPYDLVRATEAVVEAAMAETEKPARRDWRI